MNFLYYLALILILLWLIGFLALDLGALIHILLVFALISVLLRLIRGRGI
jgi:hypothetical protein